MSTPDQKDPAITGFLPIVHTTDLMATAEYYRDVLGFKIRTATFCTSARADSRQIEK